MIVKQEDFVGAPEGYEYIFVKFIQPISNANMNSIETLGGTIYKIYKSLNVMTVLVSEREVASLKKFPEIAYVEEVGIMRALAYNQSAYKWNMSMINTQPVHIYNTGQNVKVCIVDTGIQSDHSDLSVNYVGGAGFTNDPDPDPGKDVNGHGSHCAGVVAACGNHIVGVAPKANLYSCRVLSNEGSGNWAWFVDAIEWCIANGMDILSMSLGGQAGTTVHSAVQNAYSAGICMVAAAGNEDQNVANSAPASYDETIAVGAIDSGKQRAWFSNYGAKLDICAPGVDIYSTWPGNGYNTISGTSMACPHVAGLAALIKKNNSSLTPDEIKRQIGLNVEDLGDEGHDVYYGWGLIDAEGAVPVEQIGTPDELPVIITPPGPERRAASKLKTLLPGITVGSPVSVVHEAKALGQFIVEGDISHPVELGAYASIVDKADGISRREEEEVSEETCYGLFYHAEDQSIWIGRRKGNLKAEDGFEFVDTQPLLLAREQSATEWNSMSKQAKWKEVYSRKFRQNNISILRRENKNTAFWCDKTQVKMAILENLITFKRTKRKDEEKEQKLGDTECAVYSLLNIPDNNQDERIQFYKQNNIPAEWDESTGRLKSVNPDYWMPVGIVVKKPEAMLANFNTDSNQRWKYIALVEEIAVRSAGDFDESYFKDGKRQGYFGAYPNYCNSEISLYGCTGLNFKDKWKWLALMSYYPCVVRTSIVSGASAYITRLFPAGGQVTGYEKDLSDWIMRDFHPADGMIQESIAIDQEKGKRYFYTMFGKNLRIDKDDNKSLSGSIGEKISDYAGGVVYKITDWVSQTGGTPYSWYTKIGKFRVLSYEPDPDSKWWDNEKKQLDITDKLRILAICWSEQRMKVHPELKDQLKNNW